jgi:hypothetical protein
MAKMPTYQRQTGVTGAPPLDSATGGAERYAQQKSIFARLAEKVSGWTDRAVAAEGERRGMIGGLDPEFRPLRSNTIYGQAHDRAGTRAFLDTQENALAAQIDQFAIDNPADPVAITNAINGLEAKTVEALEKKNFPEARVAFAGFFGRARTTYTREAIRAKTEKDRGVFLAAANEATQRNYNEIDRAAYAGGLDDEADATIAATIEAVERRVEAGVEAEIYTPDQARRQVEEAKTRAMTGRIAGAFDRATGIDEKKKILDSFNRDYADAKSGLSAVMTGDDAERMRRYMEAGINNAAADARAALTDIDRAAGSIEDRNADGFSAPATEVAAIEAAAASTGDPVAIERVEAMKSFQALSEQLTRMSPLEIETLRRQTVTEMEKSGASARSTEVLGAIDKVKTRMADALSSDPYAWGARAQKIEPVAALTFDGGPAGASTFAARVKARDRLRQHYGDVPFFTAAEKETLKVVTRAGGAPALAVAEQLVTALGSEAGNVLAEISADAPVLANIAGRMASGVTGTVGVDAMAALEARRQPDFKPVTIRDAQEAIAARDALGGAYAADPRAESAVRAEAKLAFEKRARDMGLAGDVSDDPAALAIYEQALDEAAGGSMRGGVKYGGLDEVNGVTIVTPPDAAAGEVEDLLHRLTDLSKLPPIGAANGVEIGAGQIQGATLVTVGNGRWRVALGDPRTADPRYVMTPDGDFWTLGIGDLRRAAGEQEPSTTGWARPRRYKAWGD